MDEDIIVIPSIETKFEDLPGARGSWDFDNAGSTEKEDLLYHPFSTLPYRLRIKIKAGKNSTTSTPISTPTSTSTIKQTFPPPTPSLNPTIPTNQTQTRSNNMGNKRRMDDEDGQAGPSQPAKKAKIDAKPTSKGHSNNNVANNSKSKINNSAKNSDTRVPRNNTRVNQPSGIKIYVKNGKPVRPPTYPQSYLSQTPNPTTPPSSPSQISAPPSSISSSSSPSQIPTPPTPSSLSQHSAGSPLIHQTSPSNDGSELGEPDGWEYTPEEEAEKREMWRGFLEAGRAARLSNTLITV